MSRHTQIDKIKNKYTQDKIEVTLVEEKMTKNRLRYKKSREKPQKTFGEIITKGP